MVLDEHDFRRFGLCNLPFAIEYFDPSLNRKEGFATDASSAVRSMVFRVE
jgi:hypothetical protein